MDCEFENRCLNTAKCFRCYNLKLLKLQEDKITNRKRIIHNNKIGKSKNSWENLEGNIRDELNNVPTIKEARRSRGSGNTWFEKGDVLDSIIKVECKERKGNDLLGGEKSFTIKKSWLDKAENEASIDNTISALSFRFKNSDDRYIIMQDCNIIELVNMCKTFMHDNDVKAKEIALLKEQLKNKE